MTRLAPQGLHHCWLIAVVTIACAWTGTRPAHAQAAQPPLPSFDFRQAGAVAEWGELHDISRLEATGQGMAVHLSGPDPYFCGPARDYPPAVPLLMQVRLRSSAGGGLQVFYSGPNWGASEEHSVRAAVKHGAWQELTVFLPPLGPGTRLRIDPPGERGVCVIESISFAPRMEISAPAWPKPTVPVPDAKAVSIQSGSLVLRQQREQLGGFTLAVDGQLVATGHNRPMIGYLAPASVKSGAKPVVRWLDVAKLASVASMLDDSTQALTLQLRFKDPDGGEWHVHQVLQPGPAGTGTGAGAIALSVQIAVDAPREVVFLPLVLLLPGHGSYGSLKGQGMLAGVEYLDNEPSSSTADLNEKAGANRKVPDSARITFPLMAIQAHGRYVGLIWDRAPELAALFDSPDRVLGTDSHVLGLIAPGADGVERENGALFPIIPHELEPGRPIKASALLIGGSGSSVIPAVQQYVALKGLPGRPATPSLEDYVRLAAAAWLDTPIRSGNRFRHAVGGSFGAQPAADAAWMMDALSTLTADPALAKRLKAAATGASAEVPVEQRIHAAVGHNRYPVAPLVLGNGVGAPSSSASSAVVMSLDQARAWSQALARQFEPDGSIRYRAAAGGIDYGRTHFGDEASGLTALPVAQLLEMAAFAGDKTLIEEGLRLLRVLQKQFDQGVPRGAQTWEIPLHTPDILASAYMVKAFALGYELTGEVEFLNAAEYWAWTGVPFVYLVNPTTAQGPGAVGPFATTPVLGATNWIAPNWIGLPVQWCGLVYADSLARLARLDPKGPWSGLADGIAASGILQTYPMDHPHHGLLPDSYNLEPQSRNPADINPGTLQPMALRLLAASRPAQVPYEFRAFRKSGLRVHSPGALELTEDTPASVRFTVRPWSPQPSLVVVHGVNAIAPTPPIVRINGQPIALDPPHQFLPGRGTLILQLEDARPATVSITTGERGR